MARPTPSLSRRSTPNASGASAAARNAGAGASSGAPDTIESRRLSVAINADGSLAADGMRDATKDALRKIVTDPATATALGIQSDTPAPPLSPELAEAIARGIAEIDLSIVERATGAPREVMDQIRWNDVEIGLMKGPIAKVVGKYGGGWLAKFDDEIALLILLFTITQVKIAMARQLMAERKNAPRVINFPPSTVPADSAGAPASTAATTDHPAL